jgi:hypothetical protein
MEGNMKKFGNRRAEFASAAFPSCWKGASLNMLLNGTYNKYNFALEINQGGKIEYN